MTAYDGSGINPPYTRQALRHHQVKAALHAAETNPHAKELRVLARAVQDVLALHSAVPVGPDDEGSICTGCNRPAPCPTFLAAGGAQ